MILFTFLDLDLLLFFMAPDRILLHATKFKSFRFSLKVHETKLNSIPLSLRLRGIKFYFLAPDQHIKPSLTQLMDRILVKLFLANIKGSYMMLKKKKFWAQVENNFYSPQSQDYAEKSYLPPKWPNQKYFFFNLNI